MTSLHPEGKDAHVSDVEALVSDIEAVVFDIGGVFLIPHPDLIADALEAVGVMVDRTDHAAWHRAHHVGVRALSDHIASRTDTPDEYADDVWQAYDAAYFPAVGVAEADLGKAAEARAALRAGVGVDVWKMPLEQNIAASAEIGAMLPIAIVSNNNGWAEQQMLDIGVGQVGDGPLPRLEAVVDSTIEGVAKPNPAIFEPALAALSCDRERVLYVGDTVHADVVGARAAGIQVVQLDPYDLHTAFDHARLPDLPALVELLRSLRS